MESGSRILSKVLGRRELDNIPNESVVKIEKYYEERFEEFITSQALYESSQRGIDRKLHGYERLIQELTTANQDYEVKLESSQQNVDELRKQLDVIRADVTRYQQAIAKLETENVEYRRQRDTVIGERDALQSTLESRCTEIDRLKYEVHELEKQLKLAINAKYDAIAKYDEIQAKEASLDYKERRMEQEKSILASQLQSVTESYNSTMDELLTIRKEQQLSRLDLETKMSKLSEELKISNSIIADLTESNQSLLSRAEELSAKRKEEADEAVKMMDCYKNELLAKTKLADIYKTESEDNKSHVSELTNAITELKKMLNEAVTEYGELETKHKEKLLNHSKELEDKDSIIENLKVELKNANDLLKTSQDQSLEQIVERVAPSAAAANRLIKTGMTLTEIYSLYVKTTESLRLQERENAQLQIHLKEILHEIEERAPEIDKRNIEYDKLTEANGQIREQLDNLITERVIERGQLLEIVAKHNFLERENKKLKTGQSDLARQVCFLLKEIEQTRGGLVTENDQSVSADMSAGEVITKKLVTFNDIVELQENNQKLLLLVRDLSTKLEEFEENQSNFDQASYEAKINEYAKRLEGLETTQRHQTQMINSYIQQRDRYKLLYYEIMKDVGKPLPSNLDGSLSAENMEGVDEEIPIASTSSISSSAAPTSQSAANEKRVNELQEKLNEATKSLQTLKEEYEEYRKERLGNEKLFNEQFDAMRNEVRELTSMNCKLKNNFEFKSEQIKIQEKNAASFKKQIAALEERNKVYDTTIAKQEQTINYLREQLISSQKQMSSVELINKNLKQQYEVLRDSENRLSLEREALYRERQTQNVVLNNLEMIKCQFERSECDGRIRLEQRLDETSRECSALRRHLQEEQDRFRELSADLERKTNSALEKAEAEKGVADNLQNELKNIRGQLSDKSKQIETLSAKLQEALTPNKSDNPVAKANKRVKELEVKMDLTLVEVNHLKKELETAQETIEQYSSMARESEIQLKDINDRYTEYKAKTEKELETTKANESELTSRVAELETEIKLQLTDAQIANNDNSDQLSNTQRDLKEAYQKISEHNTTIRDLREQCNLLTADLKTANDKYTKAMLLHTSDLQAFTECKDKLSKVEDQIAKLTSERDQAVSALEESHNGYDNIRNLLTKEKDELEKRFADLNSQNAALHDQLQLLSATLSACKSNETAASEQSMNDSTHSESVLNRSINEDDGRQQLLSVIKYLRAEKDIALANVDVLRSEKVRISGELDIIKEKLRETTENLLKDREVKPVDDNPLTTAKYQEILRKLDTLNAVTDSNRMLRDERDSLLQRIKEITDRNTKIESEMFPVQEKNRELAAKIEEITAENLKLKTEALQWRQRANALVERSNKNPEDFKRLQSEREHLAKMLTAEKEKIEKVESELTAIKQEKGRLDGELTNLTKINQTLTEERRKLTEDMVNIKQINSRMTNEIIEINNKLIQRDDEVKKLMEELSSKEALLADSRNKEIQIRKIAKKYKDSYFELQNKDDERKAEQAAKPLEQQASELSDGPTRAQSEKALTDKINELNNSVTEKQEENELLRAETENLNKKLKEHIDSHGNVLKDLQNTVHTLTEEKKNLSRELAVTKTQLLTCEQNRTEHDSTINNLKFQNESRISRLEKDLAEQEKENKETIARLTRENETLSSRINQLQRQLGLQQGTKPTTSSTSIEKSPSDPARTANVKPMAGPTTQQSATVTPRRGGDTPLASIRPMSVQNSRTAAVLPTSQTSNIASVHGTSSSSSSTSSSSTASVTALVPPQQVHTTGMTGEVMSTTSSHTDYMPATSSAAAVVVAAVPPMGSSSAENAQEAESIDDSSSSSSQIVVQQQAVALVSPRQHESAPQNVVPPQSQQAIEQIHAASTSASSSTSTSGQAIAMSTHNRASSTSNTVTTTQAGHKRPREVETDSSEDVSSDRNTKKPQTKRTRVQIGSSTSQSVSESSCLEVEYQVPTSSQRDQDDDNIIIVDSDDDDDMPDEGPVEPDDAPFEEDDVDNVEAFDMEEGYEQAQDAAFEGEGADIYGENLQSDTNEVDVDESSEVINQSENQSNVVASDVGTSQVVGQSSSSTSSVANTDAQNAAENLQQSQETQQIQTISSGSDAGSSTPSTPQSNTWRQSTSSTPTGRQQPQQQQQQQQQQVQQQQNLMISYEETGDDSIVPSTPTLYVPRRADGFSEAVSSPHPQVQQAARFTFSDSASRTNLQAEGLDDTRIDLTQMEESTSRSVPSVSQANLISPQRDVSAPTESDSVTPSETTSNEPIAGPSATEASVPEINITDDTEVTDYPEDNASTTEADDKQSSEIDDIDDEEGTDGVSSEGEKTGGNELETEEEGREAEATQAPSLNTRSRGGRGSPSPYSRRARQMRRPQPITWGDGSRSPMGQDQQQQSGSPNRQFIPQQPVPPQRGQRNRRMRRPQFRF